MARALQLTVVLLTACGVATEPGPGDSGLRDAGGADAGERLDAGAPLDTSEAGLVAFFKTQGYRAWRAEAAPHPSAGPHSGQVRTFVNDALSASLQAGASSHPRGSVAVKELLDAAGTTLTGVAIDVKGEDGTWVFLEGFAPSFTGYYYRGTQNLCGNCHRAGQDFVLTSKGAL
ncbi:MAG: hypothetical protein K1X89_07110 [Myxococcaceae bacterium]|nr:hypothetical protein [Myxococcaceae bacterium]